MLSIPFKILLGSKSPRRREIMTMAGLPFEMLDIECEETLPEHPFSPQDIPLYLAEQKSMAARPLKHNELLITADTLVFHGDDIIGKPRDMEDAFQILQRLSGKKHRVISGVCLRRGDEKRIVSDVTDVYFRAFELRELEYYLSHYEVLDKAGAYAIQEWLGLIGVERIDGSYYNVMGFPIYKVYEELKIMVNH